MQGFSIATHLCCIRNYTMFILPFWKRPILTKDLIHLHRPGRLPDVRLRHLRDVQVLLAVDRAVALGALGEELVVVLAGVEGAQDSRFVGDALQPLGVALRADAPDQGEVGEVVGEAVAGVVDLPGSALDDAGGAAVVLKDLHGDAGLGHAGAVLVVLDAVAPLDGHALDGVGAEYIQNCKK